jgi:hypothetical protein
MPHYRVYVLDEHGQLVGVVNFDCTDDDAAKEHAKRLADSHEVQLWRLVAVRNLTIRGTDPSADEAPSRPN